MGIGQECINAECGQSKEESHHHSGGKGNEWMLPTNDLNEYTNKIEFTFHYF